MLCDFDKVFDTEKEWACKKLSNMNPCKSCDIYKEVERKALYGTIAERQYIGLPKSCDTCIKFFNWEMDCFNKLSWYEDNDERLKNGM